MTRTSDNPDDQLLEGIGPALSRLRRHSPGNRKDFSRNLILNVVADGDTEVTVGAVAEQLGIDPSVASRMVSEAIASGLLARAASQADARRTVLRITPAGQQLRLQFARQQRTAYEQITQQWTRTDRIELARLLIRYADDSARYRQGGSPDQPESTGTSYVRHGTSDVT